MHVQNCQFGRGMPAHLDYFLVDFFKTVEDMSNASAIANINSSGADFLIVALGVAKGQAWIENNLDIL
jgi:UDP-N-acetyl-D-mannosaminuronic acid transferase (WecB/TagA/CpsF family)